MNLTESIPTLVPSRLGRCTMKCISKGPLKGSGHSVLTVLAVILSLVIVPSAGAAIATFDDLEEGFYGEEMVVGGIRFFNTDSRVGSEGVGTLAIDNVMASYSLFPGFHDYFSSPNVRQMAGYGPGPTSGFSPFGELSMTTGDIANFAKVDVFQLDDPRVANGNSVVLEAYLAGNLVESVAISLDGRGHRHDRLVISDVEFDVLRLAGVNLAHEGAFSGSIDSVVIIPDVGSFWLISVAAVLRLPMGRRR